jgi:hypothetical protein
LRCAHEEQFSFNKSVCTKSRWNECLYSMYNLHSRDNIAGDISRFLQYRLYRRCGSKESCRDIVEDVCNDGYEHNELCSQTRKYYSFHHLSKEAGSSSGLE